MCDNSVIDIYVYAYPKLIGYFIHFTDWFQSLHTEHHFRLKYQENIAQTHSSIKFTHTSKGVYNN